MENYKVKNIHAFEGKTSISLGSYETPKLVLAGIKYTVDLNFSMKIGASVGVSIMKEIGQDDAYIRAGAEASISAIAAMDVLSGWALSFEGEAKATVKGYVDIPLPISEGSYIPGADADIKLIGTVSSLKGQYTWTKIEWTAVKFDASGNMSLGTSDDVKKLSSSEDQ